LARFEEEQLSKMIEATQAASELHHDQTGEERILRAFRYH
jgi:hypothetical protein